MIEVACQCGRKLNAPDEAAGKRAKCPKCGATLLISATKSAASRAQNPAEPKQRPPVDLAKTSAPTIRPPVDLAKTTKTTINPLAALESAAAAQPPAGLAGNNAALPTAGVTFGRSAAKTFGLLLCNAGLFLFGVFLIWAGTTNQVLDQDTAPKQVSWYGLGFGLFAVVLTPIMAYMLARSLLVRQRLVIASDRLQEVEHLGGQDVVVLQIPFANIANMQYEVTSTQRRFGINLRRGATPESA